MILIDTYCTNCGKFNMTISKKVGRKKEKGHLKKLYCVNCKKECNCAEVLRTNFSYQKSDFLLEYKIGNFYNGNRLIEFNKFKTLVKCNVLELVNTLIEKREEIKSNEI